MKKSERTRAVPPFGVADGWLVIFSRAARIWSF
jgi:hypothetical protein